MNDLVTKLTADFFKTLAHPARIEILKILAPGERCVCELSAEMDIEQSNLSQHLGLLKKQGIIVSRKEGAKVMYRILYPDIFEVVALVEKILGEQINQAQGLLKHLGQDR